MQRAAQELMARGHSFASLWAFDSNKKAIRFYERLGGLKEEKLVRNIFNFKIMSQKIVWPDLSIIGNIP
jgi:ribosomal protein S18 acetylase RimI-like enzyme